MNPAPSNFTQATKVASVNVDECVCIEQYDGTGIKILHCASKGFVTDISMATT